MLRILVVIFYVNSLCLAAILAREVFETVRLQLAIDRDVALLELLALSLAPLLFIGILVLIPPWMVRNPYLAGGLGALVLSVSIWYLIAWWSAIKATDSDPSGFFLLCGMVMSWVLSGVLSWIDRPRARRKPSEV